MIIIIYHSSDIRITHEEASTQTYYLTDICFAVVDGVRSNSSILLIE